MSGLATTKSRTFRTVLDGVSVVAGDDVPFRQYQQAVVANVLRQTIRAEWNEMIAQSEKIETNCGRLPDDQKHASYALVSAAAHENSLRDCSNVYVSNVLRSV